MNSMHFTPFYNSFRDLWVD
ncbi:hypothetical protein CP8484711_2345A, partial [Chlamydia psittaci 84-8471/1]